MLDRKGRKASWPTLSSQRVIRAAAGFWISFSSIWMYEDTSQCTGQMGAGSGPHHLTSVSSLYSSAWLWACSWSPAWVDTYDCILVKKLEVFWMADLKWPQAVQTIEVVIPTPPLTTQHTHFPFLRDQNSILMGQYVPIVYQWATIDSANM